MRWMKAVGSYRVCGPTKVRDDSKLFGKFYVIGGHRCLHHVNSPCRLPPLRTKDFECKSTSFLFAFVGICNLVMSNFLVVLDHHRLCDGWDYRHVRRLPPPAPRLRPHTPPREHHSIPHSP